MTGNELAALAIIKRILSLFDPASPEYGADADFSDLADIFARIFSELEPSLARLAPGSASELAQHQWNLLWRLVALCQAGGHLMDALTTALVARTAAQPAILYAPAFDALAWEYLRSSELFGLGKRPEVERWPEDLAEQPAEVLAYVETMRQRIVAILGEPPAEFDARDYLIMLFFDFQGSLAEQAAPDGAKRAERPVGASAYSEFVRDTIMRRYRMRRHYRPTKQNILLGNSCTSDHPVRITSAALQRLIPCAAATDGNDAHEVVKEISGELTRREEALLHALIRRLPVDDLPVWKLEKKVDSLKKALIVTLTYARLSALGNGRPLNSRFELNGANKNHVWDAVDDLLAAADPAEIGGGAAASAVALKKQGEERVDLVAPFLQPIMVKVRKEGVRVLWYDGDDASPTLRALEADDIRTRSVGQPENRNPILEFTANEELVYCPHCRAAIMTPKTDRTIMRSRFMWFHDNGKVDRNRTQAEGSELAANGFFTFDNCLKPALNTDALAQQAAQAHYDLFLISGLQNMTDAAHRTALREIDLLRKAGTQTHVEIGSDRELPRLFRAAPGRFDSIGIGEELTEARRHAAAVFGRPGYDPKTADELDARLDGKPIAYRHVVEALELAALTRIPRIYFHGERFDIVVRRGQLSPAERLAEIEAGLLAKWIVLRKLMARNVVTRSTNHDPQTRLRAEGLTDLLEAADLLRAEFPGIGRQRIELDGAYVPEYGATVILTPVRWVYGDLQSLLRIIGAGDTSSFINATVALKGTRLQERL